MPAVGAPARVLRGNRLGGDDRFLSREYDHIDSDPAAPWIIDHAGTDHGGKALYRSVSARAETAHCSAGSPVTTGR